MQGMYNTVFLDLDNTLFSFDQMYEYSAHKAIQQTVGLDNLGVEFTEFYQRFRKNADLLYVEVEAGKRTIKSYYEERWLQVFHHYGIAITAAQLEQLNEHIQRNYLHHVEPFEGAKDFLSRLSDSCRVGLITNGAVDMQMSKLNKMDLAHFFDPQLVVISEQIGINKPDPKIFHFALEKAQIEPHQALHIGDSIKHDIVGANGVGMASALIHQRNTFAGITPTYQFSDFHEATRILFPKISSKTCN